MDVGGCGRWGAARGRQADVASWQTPNYQLTADDGLNSKKREEPEVKTRTGKTLGASRGGRRHRVVAAAGRDRVRRSAAGADAGR